MSRGVRKTGRIRSRLRNGAPARVSIRRPIKRTVLIVGEGKETEPNYFRGLKQEDAVKARFAVTVKKGPGWSPVRIVEHAINLKNAATSRGEDYDEIWCVLDVEGHTKRQSLNKAADMARENGITLCLSNPCFEIWLLSHFERKARAYYDCDAVVVRLNTFWQKHHRQDYRKNDDQIYYRVSDHTQAAIYNAQWVSENHHRDRPNTADCNSSTEVYRLVGHLLGQFI